MYTPRLSGPLASRVTRSYILFETLASLEFAGMSLRVVPTPGCELSSFLPPKALEARAQS